jgi:hypothetical protein
VSQCGRRVRFLARLVAGPPVGRRAHGRAAGEVGGILPAVVVGVTLRVRGGDHDSSLFPQERANGDNLGQAVAPASPQLIAGVGPSQRRRKHENRQHAFDGVLSRTFPLG